MTRLEKFKVFLTDKYLIFRQCFVNTYYAMVHLTLGMEPEMEFDEEGLTDLEAKDNTDLDDDKAGTEHDKQEL